MKKMVKKTECANCGSAEGLNRKDLSACKGCYEVSYCSVPCQLQHWKQRPGGHQLTCARKDKTSQLTMEEGAAKLVKDSESRRAAAATSSECAICLEELPRNRRLCEQLGCGHIFCQECWLKHQAEWIGSLNALNAGSIDEVSSAGLRCPLCRAWHGPQRTSWAGSATKSASTVQSELAEVFSKLSASDRERIQGKPNWFDKTADELVDQALGYMYQCQFADAPVHDELKFMDACRRAAQAAGQRGSSLQCLDNALKELRKLINTAPPDGKSEGGIVLTADVHRLVAEAIMSTLIVHTVQDSLRHYGGPGVWMAFITRWMATLGLA